MKTMTCRQLGGACDQEFHANTFEEMAELSKNHGLAMAEIRDEPHIKMMEQMKNFMNDPQAMQEWFVKKQKEFSELPEHT